MWAKEKFYRLALIKKFNFIFVITISFLFLCNNSKANIQEKLINKYKTINTLYFDFTQKIGDKVEFGNCLEVLEASPPTETIFHEYNVR